MEHIGLVFLFIGTAIVYGHVVIKDHADKSNVSVEEHTDLTLVCTVHDSPGISWRHNDHNASAHELHHHQDHAHDAGHAHEGHDDHHDDEHHHDGEHDHHDDDEHKHVVVETKSTGDKAWESTLTIHGAELHDAGVYTCVCSLGTQAMVKVAVVPATVPVSVASKLLDVANGSKLMIICEADIHTMVTWLFNDAPIKASTEVSIEETVDKASHRRKSILVRPSIALSHRGVYTCRNSHHDHDQAKVTVTIEGMSNDASYRHVMHLWIALSTLIVAAIII